MHVSKPLMSGLLSVAAVACTPAHKEAAAPEAMEAQALSVTLLQPRANLYSAGQPAASDWQAIAARGVTTVVNLRTADEMQGRDEAAEVRAAGMRYIEIPVADGASITPDNARKLGEAINSANDAPVLVHCASANRAGGLLALMAAREEGMAVEAALEFGRKAGMKSTEARVREVLSAD
ncbi:MAG: protein tyrosine phosphatase family protein [Xanthomonadaceae bacterium]|nr:protein tyrosine phosphatase family protein [Xanthomonadaceae bacterium]